MIKKQFNYSLLLAVAAFCLCLPMLFFDEAPARDAVVRYAPMAEAFARGDWIGAFHPRFPPFFPILAGVISYLFNLSGVMACKIISALFFALTVFPLTELMKKVFNYRYALWAGIMYIVCSRLMRIAGMGLRDTAKCFFLVLAVYGLVCFFQKYSWKGALYCSLASIGLTLNRGDSLLFALLFFFAIALVELFKQKVFPLKTICAGILFLLVITPWCCYEYRQTGWPVTEMRHAMLLDKIFKTENSYRNLYLKDYSARQTSVSVVSVSPKVEKKKG